MMKSTFFTELHMKDKKAHQFYENCTVECYFQGQVIQEAGSEEKAFYLMFKGDLEEENHISDLPACSSWSASCEAFPGIVFVLASRVLIEIILLKLL